MKGIHDYSQVPLGSVCYGDLEDLAQLVERSVLRLMLINIARCNHGSDKISTLT